MFESLLLSAALSLGQTALEPPEPPPFPRGYRAPLPYGAEPEPAGPPPVPRPAEAARSATPTPDFLPPPDLLSALTQVPPKGAPGAALEPPAPVEVPAPLLPPTTAPAAAAAAAAATTPPPDRWMVMRLLQGTYPGAVLDENRMAVLGWTEASYTLSSAGHQDLPESFNYRGNEPVVQQNWLRFMRSVVTSGTTEPTYGFDSDWIFGTDYRFTLPQRGIFHHQLIEHEGLPRTYGIDPVQFYGEAYFPTVCRGLDVKVGRFYTPYGVESLEAVSTPLVSHSYIFSNGSPFTHTGVLATLTVTPVWTVQFGLVNGSDIFIDPADEPTGVATLQWTQPGGRNIIKGTAIVGPARFHQDRAVNHIDVFDVVWTHTFLPILTNNLEMLFGFQDNLPDVTDSQGNAVHLGTTTWAGVANYVTYTFSPRLAGTLRVEFFDDPQGVRTLTAPEDTVAETKGLYTAVTAGLLFKPRKGIYIQPEVRYDYNDESRPFLGNKGLLTGATAVTLRW